VRDSRNTHVVRVEHLPIGGVLEEESFKTENFTQGLLREGCKILDLNLGNLVFANDILQNGVEFVENRDPGVQIRAWPSPTIDLG
jgi:hypothetical protein